MLLGCLHTHVEKSMLNKVYWKCDLLLISCTSRALHNVYWLRQLYAKCFKSRASWISIVHACAYIIACLYTIKLPWLLTETSTQYRDDTRAPFGSIINIIIIIIHYNVQCMRTWHLPNGARVSFLYLVFVACIEHIIIRWNQCGKSVKAVI